MFYSQLVLAKKGALGKIWLAAHMEKKVPKLQIVQTNIPDSVNDIQNPQVPMALRVSGHLLLGVVRIFSRKVTYLLSDCSEALVKIKDAFRQPGSVELAPGAGTKNYDELTRGNQLADEDELDPELMSQPMLFDDEDDALLGIQIEDEEELLPAPAIEDEEEDNGEFGATSKFEHFFVDKEEEEEEEEELAPAGSKRQRLSRDADAAAAKLGAEDEEDDDDLPPIETERLRSFGGGLEAPLEASADGLGLEEAEHSYEEFGENELDPTAFGVSEHEAALGEMGMEGEMEGEGEEEGDDEAAAAADPLEGVMRESSRLKRDAGKAELERAERGKALPPRKPKRKMVIDEETQISSEQIRKQLHDPEVLKRIFRDFDAEEAASDGNAVRDDDWDPIVGPPRAPYMPAGAEHFACFQPNAPRAAGKRARLSDAMAATRADKAGADADAAFEEEEEQWRSSSSPVEQLRSADTPGSGVAEATTDADGLALGKDSGILGGSAAAAEADSFGAFDEDEAMLEDEEGLGLMDGDDTVFAGAVPPTSDEPEVDTGFDPEVHLPNVNAGDHEKAGGPGEEDPAHWNPRTRKMYEVLDDAFGKSQDASLSYNAMIASTVRSKKASAEKRKIVSGCFQELLFLTTHGLVELEQQRPYGNLLISKTELFTGAAK